MQVLKKVAGIGLVALLLSAGLIPVPGGSLTGSAYAGGTLLTDPSRSNEANPQAGDPDGPTGDIGPPTSGTVTEQPAVNPVPAKRLGGWAHWKLALRLWAGFMFDR